MIVPEAPSDGARRRQAHGLRDRAAARRGRPHADGRHRRDAGLHGARAGRGARGRPPRPTCTRSASSSTRPSPGSTRCAGARRPPRPGASASACRRSARLRRDLPARAVRRDRRARCARARRTAAGSWTSSALLGAVRDEVDDEAGTVEAGRSSRSRAWRRMAVALARGRAGVAAPPGPVAPAPVGGRRRRGRRGARSARPPHPGADRLPARAVAALASRAPLVRRRLAGLGPTPPLTPLGGGVLAAIAVGLLPRLGSLAVALVLAGWLATATAGGNGSGLAVLVLVAALPALALTWRGGGGLAPGAGARPAARPARAGGRLAGARRAGPRAAPRARARRARRLVAVARRAAHRAPAAARPAAGRAAGAPRGATRRAAVLSDALGPLLSSGALGVAVVWAGRGRRPAVGRPRPRRRRSTSSWRRPWAVGLAAATQAVAGALPWSGGAPEPRGARGRGDRRRRARRRRAGVTRHGLRAPGSSGRHPCTPYDGPARCRRWRGPPRLKSS